MYLLSSINRAPVIDRCDPGGIFTARLGTGNPPAQE